MKSLRRLRYLALRVKIVEEKESIRLVRPAQYAYALIAILLVAGVVVQVFLAGAGALVNPSFWEQHRAFAHWIELLPIVLLLLGLVARLPRRIHMLSIVLFLLFVLQYVFLYAMPGLGLRGLRALHAVNALALFLVGWHVAGSAVRRI